jgi:hypothetical protein
MHLPKITAVEHIKDFTIKVTFSGGQKSTIDMKNWVYADDAIPYLPLCDMAVFSKPQVDEYGWGLCGAMILKQVLISYGSWHKNKMPCNIVMLASVNGLTVWG